MDRKVLEVEGIIFNTQEDYDGYHYKVTHMNIEKIEYHAPQGEGDRHYCDVYKRDGKMTRVFNPTYIEFDKEENNG